MNSARAFLDGLLKAAIAAVDPSKALAPHLPDLPARGRLAILAGGVAAGAMIEAVEARYFVPGRITRDRITGIGITRSGYGRPTQLIPVVEAGYPVPDLEGVKATEKALALADNADIDDLVLVLLSGGASANWTAPVPGITLAEKQATTRMLFRSNSPLWEHNIVRKHLSRIKGGRLAVHSYPANVLTLAISNVPENDPLLIGSGPTIPDPSTLADAREILDRHHIDVPESISAALNNPLNESPKPGDSAFAKADFRIVVSATDAFDAARAVIRQSGYECDFLGDRIVGEAREVAASHAQHALKLLEEGRRAIILSGGELTVALRSHGRGGPNQEYALALALALDGKLGITALAVDATGTDGGGRSPNDPAGAFVDETTLARARLFGLDASIFLAKNDSTAFFEKLGDLIHTGPTFANVTDFRAILVSP